MQLSTGSAQLEELVLPGGSRFQYSVHPFELKNAVGAVVAVLREYRFTTVLQDGAQPPMSLYKTEEGNWYDMPAAPVTRANLLLWQLKSAIDSKEAAELNSGNDFDA
ncbi:MAG TPA: hypothetical protein VL307_11545 [Chitinophagaceae bacterium]|nr:hypothetical protein [Chitinophagaceae bacterium]